MKSLWIQGVNVMATDKKVFTLRMQPETYEKVRYMAFMERRSIAMEIENILLEYAKSYEAEHGSIPLPEDLSQES